MYLSFLPRPLFSFFLSSPPSPALQDRLLDRARTSNFLAARGVILPWQRKKTVGVPNAGHIDVYGVGGWVGGGGGERFKNRPSEITVVGCTSRMRTSSVSLI